MKAFVGLLACLAVVSASAIPKFQTSVDEIKETLSKYDPANITDLSATLLDTVTVKLTSASVSGFSKFTLPELTNDGSSVVGTFSLDSLAVNIDSLSVALSSGLTISVPKIDASISGLTVTFSASYTTSPLRLTSLSALLQVTDVSVEGSVSINDISLDISVGSDAVDTINSKAVELQERLSAIILNIANQVLAIVYPSDS